MSDVAIRVEGLGKQYRIGKRQPRYETLRESLVDSLAAPIRRAGRILAGQNNGTADLDETIWALKDVSCEVKHGEVVGIIGRNGAGKSTLLKILSRITEPTEGRVELYGRVGSLLEVGTGFHPELTGRENIFLNAAILGMKRAEINRKFDEIVAFAEIERFLDTPVKHYSSGMYVRLAFAVSAHLEPEILVVDEVLAVGDAAFQTRCLGKMGDVAREGRTVLFVSHNMGAISSLTKRAILLETGSITIDAATDIAISAYIASSYKDVAEWNSKAESEHPMQILKIELLDNTGKQMTEFDVTKGLSIRIEYAVRLSIRSAVIAINIHAADGAHILSLEDIDGDMGLLAERRPGIYRSLVRIPGNWLNSGRYNVRVGTGIPRIINFENIEALQFTLIETGDVNKRGHRRGYLLPMLKWQIAQKDSLQRENWNEPCDYTCARRL